MSLRPIFTVAVLTALVGLPAGLWPETHPLEWDGHRWAEELSPEEKMAFLSGFVAGAAVSQVYPDSASPDYDAEAIQRELQRLRAEGGLNFPYAPSLYHSRLHDYYFYVDRRDQPIYRALIELDRQLQSSQRE